MDLFNRMGIDASYIIIGIVIFIGLLFILYTILLMQNIKIRGKYNRFMAGSNGVTLEDSMLSKFKMLDDLKIETKKMKAQIESISEILSYTYQNVSLVKYDAFTTMGGRLSFSLCMLDSMKNGFILTSMHSSREGCYSYIKEIINGESYVLLSDDEKKALDQAKEKALGKR